MNFNMIPKDFPDNLSCVERRWNIKSDIGFFKEDSFYDKYTDSKIIYEDKQEEKKYIIINKEYILLESSEEIKSTFVSDCRFNNFGPEMLFKYTEEKSGKIIFEFTEEFIVQYGGYHWMNLEALIYTFVNDFKPGSDDFKKIANSKKFNWGNLDNTEILEKGFSKFLDVLFKVEQRYIVRYLKNYSYELSKKEGIRVLLPDWNNILSNETIEKLNSILYEKLNNIEFSKPMESPPSVPLNVILPEGTNKENIPVYEKKLTNVLNQGGILCYKIIPEHSDIDNNHRLTPQKVPYYRSSMYSPMITRDVSLEEQPYRFELSNSEIDYSDTKGDTQNMKKIVTRDQLTKALDWAAKNNKPLPPLGTEFYIHIGDSVLGSILNKNLVLACYSRTRGYSHKFIPFPDYSYQVFSTDSRFDISEFPCMTWDHIKERILERSPHTLVKDREDKIFFIGSSLSLTGIRKNLSYFSKIDVKENRKTIMKKGDLNIILTDITKPPKPMEVNEMGKYKMLLDLPGFGMWSTRLKFISLTGSYVIRILLLEHTWDNNKKVWNKPSRKNDIWETFTDSFLPIEFTHTIVGDYYSKHPDYKVSYELNNNSVIKIISEISKLKQIINEDKSQKKVNLIKERVSSISEDTISEYIYNLIIYQAKYYGYM